MKLKLGIALLFFGILLFTQACKKDVGCTEADFDGKYAVTVNLFYTSMSTGTLEKYDTTYVDTITISSFDHPYGISVAKMPSFWQGHLEKTNYKVTLLQGNSESKSYTKKGSCSKEAHTVDTANDFFLDGENFVYSKFWVGSFNSNQRYSITGKKIN